MNTNKGRSRPSVRPLIVVWLLSAVGITTGTISALGVAR